MCVLDLHPFGPLGGARCAQAQVFTQPPCALPSKTAHSAPAPPPPSTPGHPLTSSRLRTSLLTVARACCPQPALNPLVPSEYVVDEPVLYYGRKQVVRTDEAQWSTNLALAENGVVAERRVGIKARIKAKTVTLTAAGTLKVRSG